MRTRIAELLLKTPPMRSSDVTLMLQEQYETIFGIFDHNQPDVSPLALVTLHPAENTSAGSPIKKRMKDFIAYDIGKLFNMSFDAFLDRPRDWVELLIETAREQQAETEKMLAAHKQAEEDARNQK